MQAAGAFWWAECAGEIGGSGFPDAAGVWRSSAIVSASVSASVSADAVALAVALAQWRRGAGGRATRSVSCMFAVTMPNPASGLGGGLPAVPGWPRPAGSYAAERGEQGPMSRPEFLLGRAGGGCPVFPERRWLWLQAGYCQSCFFLYTSHMLMSNF